jgi:2-keto-4-pentenoate hydratase/2-oxohepta-3-ene-1,7-dioic acid hydratase in catechol pathway
MKIICIGRNYAEHAKELNNSVPSSEPVFFMKPDTAYLPAGNDFYIPDFTNDLHYECEVVLKIVKVGKNIQEKFASQYYNEITLGIDFTARDLQEQCKEKKLPWEKAKSFDNSAPIGSHFIVKDKYELSNLHFELKKNGHSVQKGHTKDMLFSFDAIIAYVSKFVTLKTGDLIFTGTPAGVGKVEIGDHLEGYIEGEKILDLSIK